MYSRWLAGTAIAYAVLHHLGLLPSGLGAAPEGTRWTDWLDLAVPWLVLVPAAATLHTAQAPLRVWVLFAAGAIAYTSGHGIHLSANSIGNEDPGPTAHLWDEVVGHHLWYAGVALVLAALALTMRDRPRPHWIGHPISLAVGLTWASNALGGGTELLSLLVAIAATAFGWAHRKDLGVLVLVGFLPAVAVLAVALAHSLS